MYTGDSLMKKTRKPSTSVPSAPRLQPTIASLADANVRRDSIETNAAAISSRKRKRTGTGESEISSRQGHNVESDGHPGPIRQDAVATSQGQLGADVLQSDLETTKHDNSDATNLKSPMALPIRPWRSKHHSSRPISSNAPMNSADRRSLGNAEGSQPGFTPWTGKHQEDLLSEQIIKDGFQTRPKAQNETHSARPLLRPCLKSGLALETLSSAFVSMFEQRRKSGILSAATTFKPPPRVTLTDAKRSAWLNDLINESVPLRRLSRTIPHGIRGALLLEHCLTNRIAIPRAIWLVRCVGANELRAFRRKGVSAHVIAENEQKWLREWTAAVTSFVANLIDTPTDDDRLRYSLELVFHLYSESLLIREAFLDWVVEMYSASSWDNLSRISLLLHCWHAELLSQFSYAQRLVTSTLSKYDEIQLLPEGQIGSATVKNIRQTCVDLIQHLSLDILFLDPRLLSPFSTLDFGVKTRHRSLLTSIDTISKANKEHLQDVAPRSPSERNNMSRLTAILDSACLQGVYSITAGALHEFFEEPKGMVLTTLCWATTRHRHCACASTVSSRVIGILSEGLPPTSLDTVILESLPLLDATRNIDCQALSRALRELLLHGGVLNAEAYLKWLITTGFLDEHDAKSIRTSCCTSFLLDLPLHLLEAQHLARLRKQLVRRVDPLLLDDQTGLRVQLASYNKDESRYLEPLLSLLYRTIDWNDLMALDLDRKAQIGTMLKEGLLKGHLSNSSSSTSEEGNKFALLAHEIEAVLYLLGHLGEYECLASVLRVVIQTSDMEALLVVSDALVLHRHALSHLDALQMLAKMSLQRYRHLRSANGPHRDLMVAFKIILSHSGGENAITAFIDREVSLCAPPSGIAASTPASDSLLNETVAGSEEDDELLSIFSAGTSMDGDTIQRAVTVMTSRILSSKEGVEVAISHYATFVGKLREYDAQKVETLLQDWIFRVIAVHSPDLFCQAISSMLAVRCINLSRFLRSASSSLNQLDKTASISAVFGMLELLSSSNVWPSSFSQKEDPSAGVPYHLIHSRVRLATEMAVAVQDNPQVILGLIESALQFTLKAKEDGSSIRLGKILRTRSMLHVFQDAILRDQKSFEEHVQTWLSLPFDKSQVNPLESFALALMDPNGALGLDEKSFTEILETAFDVVNATSVPFICVGLKTLASIRPVSTEERQEVTSEIVQLIEHAICLGCSFWSEVASALPQDMTIPRMVRGHAEGALFRVVQGAKPEEADGLQGCNSTTLLDIVRMTASSIPKAGVPATAERLVKVLDALLEELSAASQHRVTHTKLAERIQTLLHFALIHHASFRVASTGDTGVARSALVASLCRLVAATSPAIGTGPSASLAATAAAYYVLDLPRASVLQIAASLSRATLHSAAVRYILGVRDASAAPLRLQAPGGGGGTTDEAFAPRPWELIPDATPNAGANDAALSLRLFGARRVDV